MAFDGIPRPDGLVPLIGRNPTSSNNSGLQGAHVIGLAFWNSALSWMKQTGLFPDNLFNGVLLSEARTGSAILAAATHSGNHVEAFDNLLYDSDDALKQNSKKYLNVLEKKYNLEIAAARNVPNATQAEIQAAVEVINRNYRIQELNFIDFVTSQFLYQDKLNTLGIADLPSLTL